MLSIYLQYMNKNFNNIEQFLNQKPFKNFVNTLNEHSLEQIKNIINVFDKRYILNNRKEVIQNMMKYNVDGNWIERLNGGDKFKRDGFSLDALTIKYGENVAKILFNERAEKVKTKKEDYTKKEWKELCNKKKSNLGLDGYIEKYGKEEGAKRWNEYYSKWKNSMDKTTQLGNRKNGQTLEEFQDRHGIKNGYKLWKNKIEKRKHTLSLEGFVKRFGKNKGIKKYYQHIDNMISNCRKGNPYSKISQQLFDDIYKDLSSDYKKETKYFTLNEEQKFYMDTEPQKIIFVDFKCGNVIIEFDGEYWHSFTHAKKRDKIKDKFLIRNGYSLLRIKEQEYLQNKQQTTEKCIKFIEENMEWR